MGMNVGATNEPPEIANPGSKKMLAVTTFILAFGIWIVMSGKFDLFHLTLGAISCVIISLLATDLLFSDRQKGMGSRLAEALRFIPYCFWLLYQIVLANFHVIGLAISPRILQRDLDPHIFTFVTRLKSDFARFVLANSITLTPGTVTVRIDNDTFYVHAISRKVAEDFVQKDTMSEMERRVAWVFEGGTR
jgi:multicomponent Na+:H+ antiporter subunit E